MPNSSFAGFMTYAMDANRVDLRELSKRTGISYEYLRRCKAGDSVPSIHVAKSICEGLGAKIADMEKVLTADRLRSKFGDKLPKALTGRDPAAALFNEHVSELEPEQLAALESLLKTFLAQNAQKRRTGEGAEVKTARSRRAV